MGTLTHKWKHQFQKTVRVKCNLQTPCRKHFSIGWSRAFVKNEEVEQGEQQHNGVTK